MQLSTGSNIVDVNIQIANAVSDGPHCIEGSGPKNRDCMLTKKGKTPNSKFNMHVQHTSRALSHLSIGKENVYRERHTMQD